jgi:hypothetical protein
VGVKREARSETRGACVARGSGQGRVEWREAPEVSEGVVVVDVPSLATAREALESGRTRYGGKRPDRLLYSVEEAGEVLSLGHAVVWRLPSQGVD